VHPIRRWYRQLSRHCPRLVRVKSQIRGSGRTTTS
jgi:hypothetical protein